MTAIDMLDVALIPPPGGEVLHKSDRATIIWGDCRDPQVIASVPREYGLLCTDPPYGVRFNSGRSSTFTEIPGDDGSVDWPAVLGAWADQSAHEALGSPRTDTSTCSATGRSTLRRPYVSAAWQSWCGTRACSGWAT